MTESFSPGDLVTYKGRHTGTGAAVSLKDWSGGLWAILLYSGEPALVIAIRHVYCYTDDLLVMTSRTGQAQVGWLNSCLARKL